MLDERRRHPGVLARELALFGERPWELQRPPSALAQRPDEDVGMLSEERQKLSQFVRQPDEQGETP